MMCHDLSRALDPTAVEKVISKLAALGRVNFAEFPDVFLLKTTRAFLLCFMQHAIFHCNVCFRCDPQIATQLGLILRKQVPIGHVLVVQFEWRYIWKCGTIELWSM